MRMVIFILFILPAVSNAERLVTKNYEIEVIQNCGEGYVSCDNVTYIGKNKKSGASITLKGTTNHSVCADGVTPCKFQGYTFKNGNVKCKIYSNGTLEVIRNEKEVLLSESGEWLE